MKRLINIILSLVILIDILFLSITININLFSKNNNIKKINNKINYIELTNIEGKNFNTKNYYDNFYKDLVNEDINSSDIEKIYKSKTFKDSMYKIENDNLKYLLKRKDYQRLTTKELNNKFKKELNDEKLSNKVSKYTYELVNIEDEIKYNIDKVPTKYTNTLRYLISTTFKIIILCTMIISIILIFFINKDKFIAYIFIPSLIVGIIDLILGLSIDTIMYNKLSKFIYMLSKSFINNYITKLIFTSLIIILISLFYLSVYEKVESKFKVVLKSRIKKQIEEEI